jgi:hypothetical protein
MVRIASLVSSRDAAVFDGHGAGIPCSEFLRRLHEDDNDPYFAAIRWAVVLGDNGRLDCPDQLPSSTGNQLRKGIVFPVISTAST